MDFINSIYAKSVSENERNIRLWEDYLHSLKSLDFSLYSEKLTVPIMVPVGSRILFRGDLKHTNEITVAMGADYFAKCSINQAEIIRQYRIKDAYSKIDLYTKEREYLQNQISFSKQNLYENVGQEIVEEYSEEEDKIWREKHKQNMKQFKIQSKKSGEIENTVTEEELWNRLEELELQEEIENELDNLQNTLSKGNSARNHNEDILEDTSDFKEENAIKIYNSKEFNLSSKMKSNDDNEIDGNQQAVNNSKIDLLQQVIERQNELGEKLQQIKQREQTKSVTELDLISKLDEMEQLDELEDEMDRLDDIILNENEEFIEDDREKLSSQKIKRGVSFADEDDSETLEITFKHSDVLPSNAPYDPEKGIQRPTDIYIAFKKQCSEETTSILKKKKYKCDKLVEEPSKYFQEQPDALGCTENQTPADKTIIIKDVIERVDKNANSVGNTDARPTSLFKKKRMQNKP